MATGNINWRVFQRGLTPCPNCGKENSCDGMEPLAVTDCQHCGAPVIAPLHVRNYWLYQPLGGGGMGSVYRAIQEGTGRDFAVKVLARDGRQNPDFIQAIMREGKAATAIGRHPHIVAVVEYGEEAGEYFIVSEFAVGERLDQVIERQGPLPERTALEICRQLVDAETHICQCGYLFRDMKPENVMYVAETDTIKLYDFGLCQPIAQVASAHAVGDDLEGSPFYMPPERIVGAPEGEYSEVYSLGMLLFYLLTGRNYYSQADLEKLVAKHVSSLRVSSVGNCLQHCSPSLVTVVDRMIARTPNQRYPNLAALQEALEAAATGLHRTGPMAVAKTQTGPLASHAGHAHGNQDAELDVASEQTRTPTRLVLVVVLVVVALAAGTLATRHHFRVSHAKTSLRAETANRFGVAANVPPASLPVAEVETLVTQRVNEVFAAKARSIPDFDERQTETSICADLGIGALRRRPQKTIAEIDEEINRRLATAIEQVATKTVGSFDEESERQRIVTELGGPWPRPPADVTPESLQKALRGKITALVEEKCPASLLAERIKQAMQDNRGYRIGDRVTLYDQVGLEVTGTYRGREGNKIVIGSRQFLVSDIPAQELWKFSEALAQERTALAIAQCREQFHKERQEFAQTTMREREAEFYRRHGYVHEQDTWLPAAAAVAARLTQAREAYATRRQAAVAELSESGTTTATIDRAAVLREYGYVPVDDTWLGQDEAVKHLLEQRRAEFTRQRQNQLARMLKEIEQKTREEVFREHGYVWFENRWQSARSLIDQIVTRDLERHLATQ